MKVQNVLWWIITGAALFLWAVFSIFVVWVTYNWLIVVLRVNELHKDW